MKSKTALILFLSEKPFIFLFLKVQETDFCFCPLLWLLCISQELLPQWAAVMFAVSCHTFPSASKVIFRRNADNGRCAVISRHIVVWPQGGIFVHVRKQIAGSIFCVRTVLVDSNRVETLHNAFLDRRDPLPRFHVHYSNITHSQNETESEIHSEYSQQDRCRQIDLFLPDSLQQRLDCPGERSADSSAAD